MPLSVRAYNCLRSDFDHNPILTIRELCSRTALDLLNRRNMGLLSVAEIIVVLEQRGLKLQPVNRRTLPSRLRKLNVVVARFRTELAYLAPSSPGPIEIFSEEWVGAA